MSVFNHSLTLLLFFSNILFAEELINKSSVPTIIGAISDGSSEMVPHSKTEPESTEFKVLKQVSRIHSGQNVTLQKVEDPGFQVPLSEPTLPKPPLSQSEQLTLRNSPDIQARLAKQTKFLFLSATVYENQLTFIRWRINSSTSPQLSAWSNIDFSLFQGINGFEYEGSRYSLVMTGHVKPTLVSQTRRESQKDDIPPPPKFTNTSPQFVLAESSPNDPTLLAPMQALHMLYANEKTRLVAAREGRESAEAQRAAYLKANPPSPQDVVIKYWKRETQSIEEQNKKEEGQ